MCLPPANQHVLFPTINNNCKFVLQLIIVNFRASLRTKQYYWMKKLLGFGCGQFRTFRPGFGFGQRYHVDRHGQLTLKQLRLSVLNEMHTNSYSGPRLYHCKHGVICNSKLYYTMFKITKCIVLGNLLIKYYMAKKLLQSEP